MRSLGTSKPLFFCCVNILLKTFCVVRPPIMELRRMLKLAPECLQVVRQIDLLNGYL